MDIKDINFAIDILSHPQSGDASDIKEAFKVAIESLKAWKEALEQEPCEDCISRQAVMNCFKKWQPYMATRLFGFEKELSSLPPVIPQPKIGHWIDTGSSQECSECGEMQYGYDNFRFYCANCGCRIIGGSE